MRFTSSRSYPYLSIARHFGLDYGVVLLYADARAGRAYSVWQRWAVERVNIYAVARPDRAKSLMSAIDEAGAHFERVKQHGMDAV